MQTAEDEGIGPKVGIQIAVELIQQVKDMAAGVYITPPFSRFDYVAEIIEHSR